MPKTPIEEIKFAIKEWEVVYSDECYRYVSHDLELATMGFGTEEALKLSADGFRTGANVGPRIHRTKNT